MEYFRELQDQPTTKTLEDFYYPYTEEERQEFISLLGGVVEAGNIEALKDFVYTMREFGTHAPTSVGEQLEGLHDWLGDTYGEERAVKFANMLVQLIRPENLPSIEALTSVDYQSVVNSEVFEGLLHVNARLTRKSLEARRVLFDAALSLLQDDRSEVQTSRHYPNAKDWTLRLVASCLLSNQIDRRFEALWWALLNESEPPTDNPLARRLKKLHWAFWLYGITRLPAKDGSFDKLPLDIAPKAWKIFVNKIEQTGDEEGKNAFFMHLMDSLGGRSSADIEELLKLVDFDAWPEWARKETQEHLDLVRKSEQERNSASSQP